MQVWNSITRQTTDFLLYFLLPGMSVVLPTAWSRSLLARLSRRGWLLGKNADVAWSMASQFVDPGDEAGWKMRWKQVELLDVRDLYLMIFGRSRSVLAEIEYDSPIATAKDRVIVGMHWGPSISLLKMLAEADLNPALPYRPPPPHALRRRPFYYLFLKLACRYLVKTMHERAVMIGGAGKKLNAMLDEPGSMVVVMDAPPMAGRPTFTTPVLNRDAVFNASFLNVLVDQQKEYMFYALSLHSDGSLRKKMELQGPFRSATAEAFLQRYAEFLDQHLLADSAQWRIWHVARQFWP